MFDVDVTDTYERFGLLIGVGRSTVSDLVKREILPRGGSLLEWNKAYCANLREIAAGRLAAGDIDLATERAALARAQREKIEMQNAVTKRELAPVYLIEDVLAKAGTRAGRILDTIPGVIKRREPGLSAETIAAIAREIAKVRNIAASVSLRDLQESDDEQDDTEDTQNADAEN